ncbi:hypothetical protein NHQ30_002582 [Ciborinia camelliae]|nr:hypothetical protein NHQ30_002582 [Ciborinia camelliae]
MPNHHKSCGSNDHHIRRKRPWEPTPYKCTEKLASGSQCGGTIDDPDKKMCTRCWDSRHRGTQTENHHTLRKRPWDLTHPSKCTELRSDGSPCGEMIIESDKKMCDACWNWRYRTQTQDFDVAKSPAWSGPPSPSEQHHQDPVYLQQPLPTAQNLESEATGSEDFTAYNKLSFYDSPGPQGSVGNRTVATSNAYQVQTSPVYNTQPTSHQQLAVGPRQEYSNPRICGEKHKNPCPNEITSGEEVCGTCKASTDHLQTTFGWMEYRSENPSEKITSNSGQGSNQPQVGFLVRGLSQVPIKQQGCSLDRTIASAAPQQRGHDMESVPEKDKCRFWLEGIGGGEYCTNIAKKGGYCWIQEHNRKNNTKVPLQWATSYNPGQTKGRR